MSMPPITEIALPTTYTSECRAISPTEELLLVNGYRGYVQSGDTRPQPDGVPQADASITTERREATCLTGVSDALPVLRLGGGKCASGLTKNSLSI